MKILAWHGVNDYRWIGNLAFAWDLLVGSLDL